MISRRVRWLAVAAMATMGVACGSDDDSDPVGSAVDAVVIGPVGTAAGFEDNDGNLVAEPNISFDWNSFDPTTWTGSAPLRRSSKSVSGWAFTGLEDAQNTTSDSAFDGGTKQDADCPGVGTQKAGNKEDLKRVYVASKTVAGHVYLELAWVRIAQNTTSPSAHVAFEFNQNNPTTNPSTACPAGSGGLVERSAANGGDMLIVYDFEGGTDAPNIKLSRWIDSGACEISSNTPPCWSVATTLTSGVAEAQVNTTATALDTIGPSDETLGIKEFGEAGIDLTAAGVFPPGVCFGFGNVFAVSRSSGNSSQAQMKDLVGPGSVNITNCGTIIIRKVTSPSPDPTTTTFAYTTTGGLSPATFNLQNGGSRTYSNVQAGGPYTVTETDPGPNFALTGLDCSASSLGNGSTVTPNVGTRTVSIALQASDTVDCTYTNTLQQGAIKIHKTSSADGSNLAGAQFDIRKAGDQSLVAHVTTDSNGVACVDELDFGDYEVTETDAPAGYEIDDATAQAVTVDSVATCGSGNEETVDFTDTPLSRIVCSFESLAAGNPTSATIQCTPMDSSASPLVEGTPRVLDDLVPGTYTCTVVISD